MIHVIATIEATPGKREALLTEMRRLLPSVQAEKGCLEYGPAVDIASGLGVQAAPRENVIVMMEKWQDLDALRAHLSAAHMIEYRKKIEGLVSRVQLQVLQPA